MGLDASVRCRCFEEGKLRPAPVPLEDLYIDSEGYLASQTLDTAYKEYGYAQFQTRYGALDDEFRRWLDEPCEHADGEACSECIANWAGVHEFKGLVEEAGGHSTFPLLSTMLPRTNGGCLPASSAPTALEELDRFIEIVQNVKSWVLVDKDTGEHVWRSTGDTEFTWMYGIDQTIGLRGGKIFVKTPERHLETAWFKQIPIGKPDQHGHQRMRLICSDHQAEIEIFDSIDPDGESKGEREFCIVSQQAPLLHQGKYWVAERLRNVLIACTETGNPVRWC
ncbi:hypothetical protein [Eggerthella sinensis]|uniref:hypothetical protein n=1 Tax=Eggerthella sinensis TaxID=242230 RepID=UPI00266CA4AE|nr:hypothetical protein [Eggerthella sinensis]